MVNFDVDKDYSLIAILRILSMMQADIVVGYRWKVANVLAYVYGRPEGLLPLQAVFPEADGNVIVVSGERLMERAGVLHTCDECTIQRQMPDCSDWDIEIVADALPPYIMTFKDESLGIAVRESFAFYDGVSP